MMQAQKELPREVNPTREMQAVLQKIEARGVRWTNSLRVLINAHFCGQSFRLTAQGSNLGFVH